ncbi:hypothetical protein WMF28_37025 [Sorangium sp. So ce590]|uniref:hypothetical protein n=1 Tax=Sorangium sp. So ce590 TaxID=3133317 RepID=UPI003F630728
MLADEVLLQGLALEDELLRDVLRAPVGCEELDVEIGAEQEERALARLEAGERRLPGEAARLVDGDRPRGQRLPGRVREPRAAAAPLLLAAEPREPLRLDVLLREGDERRAVGAQVEPPGQPVREQRAVLDAGRLRQVGEVADAEDLALAGAPSRGAPAARPARPRATRDIRRSARECRARRLDGEPGSD